MGNDARGQYHRESLNTTDTIVANEKMRRIEFGEPIVTRFDLTIAEAWEQYKTILKSQRGLRDSSILTIYTPVRQLIAFAGNRKPHIEKLADINIGFLDEWIGTWNVRPATRAIRLSAICGLFRVAAQRHWVEEDPTLLLARPRMPSGGRTQPFDLDVEDPKILEVLPTWEKVMQRTRHTYRSIWARNPRTAAALVLVLRYTGLRISDAIKFDPRTLKKANVRGKAMYLYFAPHQRKTDAPVFVPILAEVAEQIIAAPRLCEAYAFWDGQTSEYRWTRDFAALCLIYVSRASGVPHIHAHRFRDTFAVDLLSHRVDVRAVSRLLGHKNVATTLNYYEHYLPGDQDNLIDAVMQRYDQSKVIPIRGRLEA
jgi:site-specific recombinase XerD